MKKAPMQILEVENMRYSNARVTTAASWAVVKARLLMKIDPSKYFK